MTHPPPCVLSAAARALLSDIFMYAMPPRCIARCQNRAFRFAPRPDFNCMKEMGFHSWYAHYPAQLAELADHGLLEYAEIPVSGMEHLTNQVYSLTEAGHLYALRVFVQFVGTIPGPRVVAK